MGDVTNAALCDFAMRWKLDGDYLRCVECDRPQIASCAHLDFMHAPGCPSPDVEPRPWATLAGLIGVVQLHLPEPPQ